MREKHRLPPSVFLTKSNQHWGSGDRRGEGCSEKIEIRGFVLLEQFCAHGQLSSTARPASGSSSRLFACTCLNYPRGGSLLYLLGLCSGLLGLGFSLLFQLASLWYQLLRQASSRTLLIDLRFAENGLSFWQEVASMLGEVVEPL